MARLNAEASMCGVGDSLYDDSAGSTKQPWFYPKGYNKMQRLMESSAMTRLQEYFRIDPQNTHARNWLSRPELPTANEEHHSDQSVALEGNVVKGPFESKEQYLRTHHGLLREDAVRPLRDAKALVKKQSVPVESLDRGWQSIGIYSKVHIRGVTFAKRGIAFEVSFSLRSCRSAVNWELSDRLLSGTLVALSKDRFHKHCIVATIAARDLEKLQLKPPRIDLYFASTEHFELDPQEELIMIEERSGFFEAQRYTMLALQRLQKEPFPLSSIIVDVQQDASAPQYIADSPVTDAKEVFGSGFEEHNVLEIAKPEKCTMDETQLQAIHHILSNKFAIIQGPPGTGKTYVSVKSLKLLLNLLEDDGTPIIVACQTNHALDQILSHLATAMPEQFARLGGQSRDQGLIKQRTMMVLRKALSKEEKDPMKTFARQRREHESKVEALLTKLELYTSGVITTKDFERGGVLTPEQCQSIDLGISMFVGTSHRSNARRRAAVQSASTHDDPMSSLKTWLGGELEVTKSLDVDDSQEYGFQEDEDLWEQEIINERKAEAGIGDEFIDQLKGRFVALYMDWRGRSRHNLSQLDAEKLLRNKNLNDGVPPRQRGALFNYMLAQLKAKTLKEFKAAAIDYAQLSKDFQRWVFERDLVILQKQRLIGMTTTGLAKFRPLLYALSPKVVMIEEAAESLEAPLVAACVPSLQHLILVGDHQQLKPSPVVRQNAEAPFFFGLSLMERMLNNDMPYKTLGVQRRMAPQISANLSPIYGDKIRDHKGVKTRRPVAGMADPAWIYSHTHLDTKDQYMSSQNIGEADMVVGLYLYLLQNGMNEKQITVLTFYRAQRKMLMQKIQAKCRQQCTTRDHVVAFRPAEHIPDVRTVDSYQGEENDVVILSLVRSTGSNSIGFAGSDNRICVAISRARFGFYVFGNMDLFTASSSTWSRIYGIMQEKEMVGQGQIRVKCTNHYKTTTIQTAEHWDCLDGGCLESCELTLACGHPCPARCHPNGHEVVECRVCQCLPKLEHLRLSPMLDNTVNEPYIPVAWQTTGPSDW